MPSFPAFHLRFLTVLLFLFGSPVLRAAEPIELQTGQIDPATLSDLFLAENGRTLLTIEATVLKKWDLQGGFDLGILPGPSGEGVRVLGTPNLTADESHLILPLADSILVLDLLSLTWIHKIDFEGASSAIFEPSGEALIVAKPERGRIYLYRVELSNGQTEAVARFRPANRNTTNASFTTMAWSASGDVLLGLNTPAGEMHVIQTSDWSLLRSHEWSYREDPALLPDGNLLLLGTDSSNRQATLKRIDPLSLEQIRAKSFELPDASIHGARFPRGAIDPRNQQILIQSDLGCVALDYDSWEVRHRELFSEQALPHLSATTRARWDGRRKQLILGTQRKLGTGLTDSFYLARLAPFQIKRAIGRPLLPQAAWLQRPGTNIATYAATAGVDAKEVRFDPEEILVRTIPAEFVPLAYSADGSLKLTLSMTPKTFQYRIQKVDAPDERSVDLPPMVRVYSTQKPTQFAARFSPDQEQLLLADEGGLGAYSAQSGKSLWRARFSDRREGISPDQLAFSADGETVYLSAHWFDPKTGNAAFSVFALRLSDGAELWRYRDTGEEYGKFPDEFAAGPMLTVHFPQSQRRVRLNPTDGSLIEEDTYTPPQRRELVCDLGETIGSVVQTTQGSLQWFGPDGATEATIHLFAEGNDWIVTTPDLHFDASSGAQESLYFRQGDRVVPLHLLFDQTYTPSLWVRLRGGENLEPLNLEVIPQPPSIALSIANLGFRGLSVEDDEAALVTDHERIRLRLSAKAGSALLRDLRLYQNGKWVDASTRGLTVEDDSPVALEETREIEVFLLPGENHFEAIALDAAEVESVPSQVIIDYRPTGPETAAGTRLFALVVGINQYRNERYNLNYAVPDASAFRDALNGQTENLFEAIEVTSLQNEEASRPAIFAALEAIREKARPSDVFLFYYAGHGVMSTEATPQFYLVPPEVEQLYGNDALLAKRALSAEQLQTIAHQIQAQKQLFILDACQSAGAIQSLVATRGAAEEKAIARLARATGTHWITATGSEQYAAEVESLGHGVFTYALLEALEGSADNGDGQLTVRELDAFLQSRVPELTREHRGSPQYPASYGFGQDFPFALTGK